MKIGIKKLEYIPASQCKDWSYLPSMGLIDLSIFTSSVLTPVPGNYEHSELSANWSDGPLGLVCDIALNGIVRTNITANMKEFISLLSNDVVFVVTLFSGEQYIIGSNNFPARFRFSLNHSGISVNQIPYSVGCKTPQGLMQTDSPVI